MQSESLANAWILAFCLYEESDCHSVFCSKCEFVYATSISCETSLSEPFIVKKDKEP